jgi:hypothetical protein
METSVKRGATMQALEPAEMQSVCGGAVFYPDITGMPDRTIICGTIWILDQIFGRMTGTR